MLAKAYGVVRVFIVFLQRKEKTMRTLSTWTCMILGMGMCGLVVSDALSWERWVNSSWVAAPPALAQEIRPAASPVLRPRFARPMPRGWEAPSLVEARDRPDETWRPGLTQLGLPVTAQTPRLGVGLAGVMGLSMGRDTVAPLPRIRLVKDVLDAMPDMCDERLFGKWYCGIGCLYDDCEAWRGTYTISRSIDPDGYERIHERYENRGIKEIHEWKVERKWGTFVSSDPLLKGKLAYTSCNGRTNDGYSRLAVNLRNPDGSNQRLVLYWVDGANQKMWVESYEILWDKDKVSKKISTRDECRRDLKRYR